MKIDATTTTAATTGPGASALRGSKDEFLRLFMAQLRHQDPFDPKNSADMVAQLAQFSSVEQATQTNQHLIDLANAQAATSSASLANLVGRDCNAATGGFQLDRGGGVPALEVTSSTPLVGASVVITSDSGKELRRIAIPNGSPTATVQWDGKDASGVPAPPGGYQLSIDPGTTASAITSQWHGRVQAVELTPDGTRLRMGGVLLSPSDIRTIGLPSDLSTSTPTTRSQDIP